jgi:DNA-binding transcriptional regulator YiaG
MANRHSLMWRAPGRRDEARKEFARLMARVEKVRVREGWTKQALAAELDTSEDALRNWMTG